MAGIDEERERNAPERARLEKERATLVQKIEKLQAKIEDWASRVYAENTNRWSDREEIPGPTFGTINERRRRRRIAGFQADIEALEKQIATIDEQLSWL